MPKISPLGQKLWPTGREHTDTHTHTHRHTEVLIPEDPIRASAFQASACDMSGPIICNRPHQDTKNRTGNLDFTEINYFVYY